MCEAPGPLGLAGQRLTGPGQFLPPEAASGAGAGEVLPHLPRGQAVRVPVAPQPAAQLLRRDEVDFDGRQVVPDRVAVSPTEGAVGAEFAEIGVLRIPQEGA